MAIEIRVPRLGWNMEEGVFLGWLKRDGEAVRPGEPLFTLEGDKAVQEIEATDAGILCVAEGAPAKGDGVLVGALLGYLRGENEARPTAPAPAVVRAAATTPVATPAAAPVVVSAPARRERAVTPRARRAARQLGVDLGQAIGTGRNGRVRERDVTALAAAPSATRQRIAERMVHSLRSTAPVTLTTTADATELVVLRRRMKTDAGPVASVTDLFVKLAAVALQAHPSLNARWDGDRAVSSAAVHVGVAVDTDAGLLVPVIRDVPALSLAELAGRSRDLIDRARTRRLRADEMQGGTFTVTNLGAYGIDAFTPIINWPECAILGVGRIRAQPAVVAGRIVARDLVALSLTFDHRALDGAAAARFLQTLAGHIETPAAALRPWGEPA
jgi:pyruvate dehydrogenase E2 component (dihydrolipoamide acetyltransferase)